MIIKRILSLLIVCCMVQQSACAADVSFFARMRSVLPSKSMLAKASVGVAVVAVCAAACYAAYRAYERNKVRTRYLIDEDTDDLVSSQANPAQYAQEVAQSDVWQHLRATKSFNERIAQGHQLISQAKIMDALCFVIFAFDDANGEKNRSEYTALSNRLRDVQMSKNADGIL